MATTVYKETVRYRLKQDDKLNTKRWLYIATVFIWFVLNTLYVRVYDQSFARPVQGRFPDSRTPCCASNSFVLTYHVGVECQLLIVISAQVLCAARLTWPYQSRLSRIVSHEQTRRPLVVWYYLIPVVLRSLASQSCETGAQCMSLFASIPILTLTVLLDADWTVQYIVGLMCHWSHRSFLSSASNTLTNGVHSRSKRKERRIWSKSKSKTTKKIYVVER